MDGFSVDGNPLALIENLKHYFVDSLLPDFGNADLEISVVQHQFCLILSSMMKQSSKREEGKYLSDREEMLLSFANIIPSRECDVAKSDGINRFYAEIDAKDKLDLSCLDSDEEKPVAALCQATMQKMMQDVFSSDDFLSGLENSFGERSLPSHQTLYLKNRFAHLVGHEHSIADDEHPSRIGSKPQAMKKDDFIKRFFDVLTPSRAVGRLVLSSNGAFENDERFYNSVVTVLQKEAGRSLGLNEPQKYIKFRINSKDLNKNDFLTLGFSEEKSKKLSADQKDAKDVDAALMKKLKIDDWSRLEKAIVQKLSLSDDDLKGMCTIPFELTAAGALLMLKSNKYVTVKGELISKRKG